MSETPNNLAAYCWSISDLLRGDCRQSQYGRVMLLFTLLQIYRDNIPNFFPTVFTYDSYN
jgi:type I restriction-modification system DNA methylase subunit